MGKMDKDGQNTRRLTHRHGTNSNQNNGAARLLLFAKTFFKHPNMVGWMLPSSPFVVQEVLKQVDWDQARVIVEYGPGVGTFTAEVLARMHPEATLIALETNAEFFQFLSASLRDPRLRLIHESA